MLESNNTRFTIEQLRILFQGLVTLEGAIKAIDLPVPEQIVNLKGKLRGELQSISELNAPTVTTDQVARFLGCSGKRIHQLASEGAIKIAQIGKKGRGNTTFYFTESVKEYASKKK